MSTPTAQLLEQIFEASTRGGDEGVFLAKSGRHRQRQQLGDEHLRPIPDVHAPALADGTLVFARHFLDQR